MLRKWTHDFQLPTIVCEPGNSRILVIGKQALVCLPTDVVEDDPLLYSDCAGLRCRFGLLCSCHEYTRFVRFYSNATDVIPLSCTIPATTLHSGRHRGTEANMREVVIIDAVRTPIGRYGGAL